jgi:uncharacterized membrane protein
MGGQVYSRRGRRISLGLVVRSFASTWFAVAFLTGLGGILRLNHLGMAGFDIDEGFTLTYARQGWIAVFGLDGHYSPHPPLFFALAKIANLFVREEIAARSVSALAGTLTIPLVFFLCRRMVGTAAGIAAATLLVVAPLHVEYSRIGRMYAPVVLFVTLSYFALVSYWQSGKRIWAFAYGGALVLAVYTDYSAIYALIPQAVALPFLYRQDRARGREIIVTCGVAALLYLPWLPQIAETVSNTTNATGRNDYLGASWDNIGNALMHITGLDAWRSWAGTPFETPWRRWPADHGWLIAILSLTIVVGGAVAAITRRGAVVLLCVALTAGTLLSAIAMSLVSPGFASRTVMTAVIGWVILASVFLIDRPIPKVVRLFGFVSWSVVFGIFILALPPTYDDGKAEEFPALTNELLAMLPAGKPVVIFSTAGMLTDLIDLYGGGQLANTRVITLMDGERETWTGADRWLSRGITIEQMKHGGLANALPVDDPGSDAFWFINRFGGYFVLPYFRELGYSQLGVIRLDNTDIELWARPGAELGTRLEQLGDGTDGSGWTFAGTSSPTGEVESGEFTVTLDRPSSRATLVLPAGGPALYVVQAEVWSQGNGSQAGVGRMSLRCFSSMGDVLARRTTAAASDDVHGASTSIGAAVLCPEGTASIKLVLHRDDLGSSVTFGDVEIQRFEPAYPLQENDQSVDPDVEPPS